MRRSFAVRPIGRDVKFQDEIQVGSAAARSAWAVVIRAAVRIRPAGGVVGDLGQDLAIVRPCRS
jgi:hypothetical protein